MAEVEVSIDRDEIRRLIHSDRGLAGPVEQVLNQLLGGGNHASPRGAAPRAEPAAAGPAQRALPESPAAAPRSPSTAGRSWCTWIYVEFAQLFVVGRALALADMLIAAAAAWSGWVVVRRAGFPVRGEMAPKAPD